jgi:dTDP-4-dehydrorhamnose 3,5-epimerase
MWKFTDIPLQDARLIQMPTFADMRGDFVKTYNTTTLLKQGMDFTVRESYFSHSHKDVIRGMHFQTPPHQHAKIVFCPQGAIMDVIVDLRRTSPTYGQHYAQVLSAANALGYYIPQGFAHGFRALEDNSITYYLVSSEYSPDHDKGILYNSFGFDWGTDKPIISDRDLSFVKLEEFDSPF